MFATKDHNIKMFLKIAIFLQNQFIKKLICDLISQLIFKLFSTNEKPFQDDSNSMQYVQLVLVFILKKKMNFLFLPKVVSPVKTGDFNTKNFIIKY